MCSQNISKTGQKSILKTYVGSPFSFALTFSDELELNQVLNCNVDVCWFQESTPVVISKSDTRRCYHKELLCVHGIAQELQNGLKMHISENSTVFQF